ncbi:MAG: DUF3604 domain-containing protein [Promethearchaeota archaeon]
MCEIKLQNLKVQPKSVIVRTHCDLTISFIIDFDLPQDSNIFFRFRGGRNNKNDWYCLQPFDPKLDGYFVLKTNPSSKMIPLLFNGKELGIKYIVVNDNGIEAGTQFNIKIRGTLVQSLVEKSKKIEIIIEYSNQKPKNIQNPPTIDIIHNKFHHLTIICPSIISINEDFEVLIRAEDKYKNLIENFESELKLYFSDQLERQFPLPNQKFEQNNKGILKILVKALSKAGKYNIIGIFKGKKYRSNPIIYEENPSNLKLYWGFIHAHTNKSDGMLDLDDFFHNLLNAGLDFGTNTEHDHEWETLDIDFSEIKQKVKNVHEDGKFVCLFGYEWGYWYTGNGDICIYHYDDSIPILRSDTNKYNSTAKLIKNLKPFTGKVLMIGHHTALRPGYRNWDSFDNSVERLVEIYSTWGNQEYSSNDGNPLPPRYKFFGYGPNARKRGAILEKKGSFVQDALKRGYKLGFTAGGDDHFGVYPSGSIDPDNGIYPLGIMAVWAKSLTKKDIWDALFNRKCYGTTGPRIIIKFFIEDYSMGDIINLENNKDIGKQRKVSFSLVSPVNIEKIELIRNNESLIIFTPNSETFDVEYVDDKLFNDIALDHFQNSEKFVFYYLRIFLKDNNMAWSSPIWFIKPY